MEFTIAKDKLLAELTLAAAVVERKTTIPILSTVRISATEQNAIQISASDISTSLTTTIDADVKEPGAVCLPSIRLTQLVRTFPDGPVKIKVGENRWASISAGKTKARIAGNSTEAFPDLPSAPDTGTPINARLLVRQIATVDYCISNEESRFTLNGFLMVMDSALTLVATDGHRMSWSSIKIQESLSQELLVPKSVPAHLARIVEGCEDGAQIVVSSDSNHMYFASGDRLLISRRLSGSFPDYKRVLPKPEQPVIRTFNRLELKSAITQVLQFADDATKRIGIALVGGEARVYANAVDKGECEAELACDGSGDVDFGLAGQYLVETLDAITTDRVRLLTADNRSALEWQPEGDSGHRAIIMPMRY